MVFGVSAIGAPSRHNIRRTGSSVYGPNEYRRPTGEESLVIFGFQVFSHRFQNFDKDMTRRPDVQPPPHDRCRDEASSARRCRRLPSGIRRFCYVKQAAIDGTVGVLALPRV